MITGSTTVTVSAAMLTGIVITPGGPTTIGNNSMQTFTAVGTLSDGTMTWT